MSFDVLQVLMSPATNEELTLIANLSNMGFRDYDKNLALIRKYCMNMEKIVNDLLTEQINLRQE